MDITKMDERFIVDRVNELYHLQETPCWERRARIIVSLSLKLKYIEGKLDALRSLQGQGFDEDKLFASIDKLEQREFDILKEIEEL